jgi:hypothetical protein
LSDADLRAYVSRIDAVMIDETKPRQTVARRVFDKQICDHAQELRNEQVIYRAALALVEQLKASNYDRPSAQQFMEEISGKINDWPRQWSRENSQRGEAPHWKLSSQSLTRMESLTSLPPDRILPALT